MPLASPQMDLHGTQLIGDLERPSLTKELMAMAFKLLFLLPPLVFILRNNNMAIEMSVYHSPPQVHPRDRLNHNASDRSILSMWQGELQWEHKLHYANWPQHLSSPPTTAKSEAAHARAPGPHHRAVPKEQENATLCERSLHDDLSHCCPPE